MTALLPDFKAIDDSYASLLAFDQVARYLVNLSGRTIPCNFVHDKILFTGIAPIFVLCFKALGAVRLPAFLKEIVVVLKLSLREPGQFRPNSFDMLERVAVDCIVGLCPSGVGDHKCRPFGRLQNLDGIFVVIKIGMPIYLLRAHLIGD